MIKVRLGLKACVKECYLKNLKIYSIESIDMGNKFIVKFKIKHCINTSQPLNNDKITQSVTYAKISQEEFSIEH